MGCFRNVIGAGRLALAFVAVCVLALLAGCSNTSSTDSAGILIETNTGNKVLIETNTGSGMARVLVLTEGLDIAEGDTLRLSRTVRDSVGDTVFISMGYLEEVAGNANLVMGYVAFDSVPALDYDALIILSVKGGSVSIVLGLNAEDGATYRVDDNGVEEVVVKETKITYRDDYPEDSTKNKISHVFFDTKTFGLKGEGYVTFDCKREVFRGDSLIIYDSGFGLRVEDYEVDMGITDFGIFDSDLDLTLQGGKICSSVFVETENGKKTIPLQFKLGDCPNYYVDSTGAKCVEISDKEVTEGKADAYFDFRDLDRKVGDTLKVKTLMDRTMKDDIVYSTFGVVRHVLDSVDVASGLIKLENLPEALEGSWGVYITGEGMFSSLFALKKDESAFVFASSYAKVSEISVKLPDGFGDLSSVEESFKDMPLPIRLDKQATRPCLVDANRNVIALEKSEGDSLLYWGRLDQVIFGAGGTLNFDLLDSCYRGEEPVVELSRRTLHLDNENLSDAAFAKFKSSGMRAPLGGALWTDSTDMWMLVDDFDPFTENGKQMSASIWIKGDSASQAALPEDKSYTRLLSCKKDSVGFILQQRANQAAVNLRLDARVNGKGVYNSTYGTARILDGEWHNYSFTLRGDSVFIYADGVKIETAKFDSGEGFSACINPSVGYERNFVGGVDEIFFFDGTQSDNWMRLFYALQYAAIKE